MRVGFIVDGEAEFRSLSGIYPRLGVSATLLAPLKSDIQPLAPLPQIAASIKIPLRIMHGRGADLVVVLLDREMRTECPGDLARSLSLLLSLSYPVPRIAVVMKDRRFENWLVSDPEVFRHFKARFRFESGHRSQVAPDKADHIDALAMLKRLVIQQDYSKVKDAVQILRHAEPSRMARNSRSFRRFLRLLGHPAYSLQSRRPNGSWANRNRDTR
jgi:hypothetical protein